MLDPGKMDRRVTIQRHSLARNANNEPVEGWSDLATVWASKHDVSDGEKARTGQVGSSLVSRFATTWRTQIADVNAKDRLRFNGKVYDIVGVKEIGRRDGIEITASRSSDQP